MAEDDVGDTWEDLEDSGELDKQIQKLTVKPSDQEVLRQDGNSSVQEESDRLSYQPQVRILKRQPKPNDGTSQQATARLASARPTKTLAEREAAYAEARMRILGAPSADNEETIGRNGPIQISQQLDTAKVTENVVRQPKGPDGSKGFGDRDIPR
ncbi:hypothetical protein LSH36_81g06046 [Paralvinella palmiformis]|uniref:SUZ RNA-binding domain-containing n=1 Tax=Paralvinella palmiformis TaxID=53620 RepID=A0AAD9NCP2_9ANNE|nr:hypothetical protein LSH36_81g06046 [Paralvinella palmiformis]